MENMNKITILGFEFENGKVPWLEDDAGQFYDDFWKAAYATDRFTEYFEKIERNSFRWHVINLLEIQDIEVRQEGEDVRRVWNEISLGALNAGYNLLRRVYFTSDLFHLEARAGFFGVPLESEVKIVVMVNGKEYPTQQRTLNGYNKDKSRDRGEEFVFELPLKSEEIYQLEIIAYLQGYRLHLRNFSYGKFSYFVGNLPKSYYAANGWALQSTKDFSKFSITPCDITQQKKLEREFCKALSHSKSKTNKHAVWVRKLAFALREKKKKPIWLVSDRVAKADDNAEAFFKYLNENKKHEVDSYFVIEKDSPDFERLKAYGKVVPFFSWKHRLLYLRADYLVSSQVNDFFLNPFRGAFRIYKNMLDQYRYVFLQHGIISNDLSGWLRRQKKYLYGFVVTTKEEYYRVLNGDYDYSEDEIWLTGMPRYDYLEDHSQNVITILPTWRMYLATKQNKETGFWELVDDFTNTTYATFYRNLLSSEKLNEAANRLGYKIQFKLHPSFTGLEDQFDFPEYANIIYEDTTYRQIYSESNLIVSDYSSAIYDFLYLRKPIIYTQFDADEFFAGKHIYEKGDFDYETQGFGEVEYDLDGTVNRIIEYMENGCQLKDKYRERIENFFMYNDRNNCQRIYDRMIRK